MLKTRIILPDGTVLTSGTGQINAIGAVTLTQCVNSENELTLGSVCSSMLEATVITPEGALSLEAGTEVSCYKGDVCMVLYTLEKPTRASANTLKLTAYDRVSWLDQDLTEWLGGLVDWPYSLYDLAWMVSAQCGLELANESLPNGDYPVRQFSASGVTGRQLMQWIGQVAGRFCRATADGKIEFAWYTPVTDHAIGPTGKAVKAVSDDGQGNVSVTSDAITATDAGQGIVISDAVSATDDGEGNVFIEIPDPPVMLPYYQNALSFEDYAVSRIEKVQLRQTQNDVGAVYPDVTGEVNTYIITGNLLLSADSTDELKAVAQTLHEQLKDITYTPCKVSMPASVRIRAGDIVSVTDRNGKTVTVYVMKRTLSGQRDTLECTGSYSRDSSTAVNNQSYTALSGRVLELSTQVEGLKTENRDAANNAASLELAVEGIYTQVQQQEQLSQNQQEMLTALEQNSRQIQLAVQSIQQDGTTKVKTEMGYTFDNNGLHINKSGSDLGNSVTEKGMYVIRGGDTVILQADANGVIATDVSARNYLIIGNYARFEDYADGTDNKRTACFFIGG